MNINRDYLIINDVKKSNVKLDNGSIIFYITDKNTQNIFVNLVINVSNNDLIQKYANIENAEDYTLTMNIVKPSNTYKIVEGKLHDKEKAIFEFDLKEDCCDEVGTYKCELLTKCNINDHEEITTSNKLTYKVKSSVLNDLDEIVEAPEYPLVIQLFDKLSDIEQYEEDRRTNELARQLAEQQRQTRFDTLDADMTDSIQAMDDKVVDVENRIASKEQAVDKLIVDTKADIDEYKVAKDSEIDEYKTAKDIEINEAIANQNTAINAQNDRITVVENNVVAQNSRLDVLETKATTHEARITSTEAKNTEQDSRLDVAENRLANIGNDITNTMQPIIDEHTSRLEAIEAIDVAQNTRLDAIEVKNQQQDDRLLDIEKVNNRQDIDIKCLYGASQTIDVAKEGNSIHLQNSNNGFAIVDEIKGNTLVNCNKEPDKELILNGNINTSGDNTVTITEGVDGGLVDVALEGNTLVNVSKTKDSTAISKAYTVKNSGNHIVLQGDIDGKCRPVITGNTLVNIIQSYSFEIGVEYNFSTGSLKCTGDGTPKRLDYQVISKTSTTYTVIANIKKNTINNNFALVGWNITEGNKQVLVPNGFTGLFVSKFTTRASDLQNGWCTDLWQENTEGEIEIDGFMILEGDYTNQPIPDYFTGLQSSFEDNLVTQEMVDNGEEVADNLGKYRVDYKVTGKNKFDLSNLQVPNGGNCTIDNGSIRYYATIDELSSYNGYNSFDIEVKLKPNTIYSFKCDSNVTTGDLPSVCGGIYIFINGVHTYSVPDTTKLQKIETDKTGIVSFKFIGNWSETKHDFDVTFSNIQLEEGDTLTSYEPYKEATKTLYLNSPLLKGDTIEEKDGGIYHVHRYTKVVFDGSDDEYWEKEEARFSISISNVIPNRFSKAINNALFTTDSLVTDDQYDSYAIINGWGGTNKLYLRDINKFTTLAELKQYLQQNPITIVYELASPQYELIEQSNLAIPSYTNGHLDLASAVPVSKVNFLHFEEELTYLYPSTPYTIQFTSDKAISIDITLGGTELLAQNIVKGLNRISITTPETLVDNKLIINGVGANISEVVVTDTNREFMYFEGMKSVGECEELEVVSNNKNLWNWDDMYNQYGNTNPNVYKKFNGTLTKINDNEYSITPYQGGWYEQGIFSTPVYLKQGESVTFSGESSHFNNVTIFNLSDFTQSCTSFISNLDETLDDFIPFTTSYTADKDGYYVCRFWISNNKTAICRNIQVEKSSQTTDYIPHQLNKQQLTHEPLRAVGDAKDRYVLIDGKWYIERRCCKGIITNNSDILTTFLKGQETCKKFKVAFSDKYVPKAYDSSIVCNDLLTVTQLYRENDMEFISPDGYNTNIIFSIKRSKLQGDTVEDAKTYLQQNPLEVIYVLATPQYEPINYNPLEVYSDITHITTNSAVPTNITIKNHGFNCLLKPSTTYTISSNLGLNTVTTPSVLTEDCLRFMDTDTSDVTTMKDVLVLEGDWTTKADLIPSNFSGIESAFEQELVTDENDENYGKYKVDVKVIGKNLWRDNVELTAYDWSELIKLDKNKTYTASYSASSKTPYIRQYDENKKRIPMDETFTIKGKSITGASYISIQNFKYLTNLQLEEGDTATEYEPYKESDVTFYLNEPLRGIGDVKDRVFIKDDKVVVQRNCGNLILDGSDDENWVYAQDSTRVNTSCYTLSISNGVNTEGNKTGNAICDKIVSGRFIDAIEGKDIEGVSIDYGMIFLAITNSKLQTQDVVGLKQWLQQNPATVVYQLAEPVYEEVEYNDTKLLIESFKNSTLSYNSNVPVTSKLHYSYSVPIVDTVAQTASISDEQDVMIIDLATQVAVMEMMLM